MAELVIDGSAGEGGGQILRSALSLSLITGRPFRIERIRAARKRPGLLNQHLTAVRAAVEVGEATVEGATYGSCELRFHPHDLRAGEFRFDVGSAGSATLVLQTVLPAMLIASAPSQFEIRGGTHNPFAPPFEFLERTFAPVIERMGPRLELALRRPGFYPAGGGCIEARVDPVAELNRLDLSERGEVRRCAARAAVARLPRAIAERELAVVGQSLGIGNDKLAVSEVRDSAGPGNVVQIEIENEHVTEVITGFGRRGVRAEKVARSAARAARYYLDADVPVGQHLADQLLLPLALAGRGTFRTCEITSHTRTNIEVIRRFLDVAIDIEEQRPHSYRVTVS